MTDDHDCDLEGPASALVDDLLEGALETDDPLDDLLDDPVNALLNHPLE